jgi:hypothetical protein
MPLNNEATKDRMIKKWPSCPGRRCSPMYVVFIKYYSAMEYGFPGLNRYAGREIILKFAPSAAKN